jgi:hypothetical protein
VVAKDYLNGLPAIHCWKALPGQCECHIAFLVRIARNGATMTADGSGGTMAHYLRDQEIRNVTVNEAKLRQLASVFEDLRRQVTQGMTQEEADKQWFLSYTIRFDRQGHRVYSLDEAMRYYAQAMRVERIIITLESAEALRTNHKFGAVALVRLDAEQENDCWIVSTSDVKAQADAGYSAIAEALASARNRNGFIRSTPMRAVVQILGAFVAFALSLWGAAKFSPFVKVESSFAITLLFLFVMASALWSFVSPPIFAGLYRLFPNIRFDREGKNKLQWLWRSLASSAIGAMLIAIAVAVGKFVADGLSSVIGPR